MFWADKLLENINGKQVINDSWTPSGMVHMGSLKGPVIHGTLYRILKEKKSDVHFMYGFDDADPIDGLPPELQDSHSKYLGVPIFLSPSPDGNGSFGDFFGNKMKKLLDELGIKPTTLYRTSELYKNGVFNKAITFVLDNAQKIRDVYGTMYKKTIPPSWYPLQVICPNCGKLGTTRVTDWNGKEVAFSCEEDLVKWANGCKTTGKISPFNGNGKMPWKVEWAAKWWTFNVTIEGAGKDHASAGGSYDVAMELCNNVFKKQQPLKLAYEFFLTGGKKMSSSKGVGLTGEELLEVLGPQRARFLMIKTPPNQAVEFTPYNTDIIPRIFDEYQKAGKNEDPSNARAFIFSQIGDKKEKIPEVRFLTIAQWVQMPNMEENIKKMVLGEWAQYAKVWVEKYAPESEKFLIQKDVPAKTTQLSEKQKEFLRKIAKEISKNWNPEEFQECIYTWAKEIGLPSKDAFSAIYISFIGKDHGPKAAWILLSLNKEFVKKRFQAIVEPQVELKNSTPKKILHRPDIFIIDEKVKQAFPSISVGVAIIKNVTIKKINKELEQEKEILLQSLDELTTEQLGQYPEIISYRKLYKEMKVDWHSKRPSPEALLRRVALKKGLYMVNSCVDAYNLVVMKQRVSIGAFDLDKLAKPTMLRFAKEGEEILLLGDTEPTKYKTTELGYFDQKGGYNIDFNYRDAKNSAVEIVTNNLYINVDGVYDITPEKVEQVLKEACDNIIKYCGGKLETFGVETS